MKFLVCGDRNWTDWSLIYEVLMHYWEMVDIEIIDGHARGADRIAHALAYGFEWPNQCFPADWKRNGKAAGPIRNRKMQNEGKPDYVLAFHDDIEHSKGTADMVRYAKSKGVPVTVFTHVQISPVAVRKQESR